MDLADVFAIDGHDGAGKSTLARWLAGNVNGSYQRPYSGPLGAALMNAGSRGDVPTIVALGEEGISNGLKAAGAVRPIILDRAWITLASFVDWPTFASAWRLWIPTVVCWADLPTTLSRLSQRSEESESVARHRHYLGKYLALAEHTASLVIRTDLYAISECQDMLTGWLLKNPSPPRILPK